MQAANIVIPEKLTQKEFDRQSQDFQNFINEQFDDLHFEIENLIKSHLPDTLQYNEEPVRDAIIQRMQNQLAMQKNGVQAFFKADRKGYADQLEEQDENYFLPAYILKKEI